MHLISALIAMIKKYTITLRAKNHQGLLALKLIENENKNLMKHLGMPACSLVDWGPVRL